MKKVLLVLVMMVVLGSQSAMALTEMTDESLSKISAQSGIRDILDLNEISQGSSLLDNGFNLAKGIVETRIEIEDAVIDIDHLKFSFFKSEEFTLGTLSMKGIHMEVGKATISIWEH